MSEKTMFPRELHTDVLFEKILNDPWACERLQETFCDNLVYDNEFDTTITSSKFAESLFNAYKNRDLSAFLMCLCNNTVFDLLRNSYLIPYRFNADGKPNPIIFTNESGNLLPGYKSIAHEKDYQHFTLFLNILVSISASCFVYAVCLKILEIAFHVPSVHEAGYICSMLFIIPGFPFITSGIDLAKLDLRSGLERLSYAIIIVLVATMFAWIMALLLSLRPLDFTDLNLDPILYLILRLIASFFGVFGFSIMFNSSTPMAATAAIIGAIANTLRLELVDLTSMPAPAAAFAGALTAGLLASIIKKNNGYPRISLTVPSIVIMVPGLYLYRAIYNFGIMALSDAVSWFASAIMIIIALPLGLIFARILTDKTFRYCT